MRLGRIKVFVNFAFFRILRQKYSRPMKFWKTIFSTAVFFIAITGVIVYTSCEKDPCTNVSCLNGGSCKTGVCVCPSSFEGPTCNQRVIDRFLGYYAGYTGCNSGAQVIDTIFIVQHNPKKNLEVRVIQKIHPLDTLYGTVSSNESTYSISFPDKVAEKYHKYYHITLQSDQSLLMYTYERDARVPGDSVVTQCNFVGTKQTILP